MAVERQCEWCGKKFYVSPSVIKKGWGKFCSHKCKGLWQSENVRGENSPRWKDNDIEVICGWCKKEFFVKPYALKRGRGKFCSKACEYKWRSENIRGENSPSWKGGEIKMVCNWCKKEFKIKPSAAKKGRGRFCSYACRGKWQSKNARGKDSPIWKDKVKKICEQCGKELEIMPSLADRKRFCSRACRWKWQSENKSGANHWNWQGGIASEPYGNEWTEELKEEIRRRDDYTCAISGEVWQSGQEKFPVHHIDYDKTNDDLDNLITLSRSSHARTNFNRRHWQALLTHAAKGAEMHANAFVNGI